ncbi:hypothetical protein [Microbacterium excoecariae]|uniref:hypothetical protein n=1 Tax=Microbacterium excoecariae TaxID=2715210 RepID=UPI0014081EB0|nr:hypothetical protein [Microbacterium excoecariae]NHI16853.1 hypothetical protein [Microbacterium excoecariae]
MRDREQIRRMFETAGTIRGTARELRADRNTIRRALAPGARDRYHRPLMADEYEPAVRDVLADHPRLTVPQVAEIIEWPGARRTLAKLVARIRPLMLERETEHLARPQVGTVNLGRMSVGRASAGALAIGRIRGRKKAGLPEA